MEPYKKTIENKQRQEILPKTWTEATISLLHKENTDPKEVRNYRLISLLNVDYKIFVTILATRLKKVLVDIIHPDQKDI